MIDAATLSNFLDTPINRLLTIRTAAMRMGEGTGGILRDNDAAGCVKDILDRIARWCKYRSTPVANIWVREFCPHNQEHLHMGYYMPSRHDEDFANQLASWLDEDYLFSAGDTKEDVAMSVHDNWNIRRCLRGGTTGTTIAAYLGKSEPNEYLDGWGKQQKNSLKASAKYKVAGVGPIEGTVKYLYRWGRSQRIGRMQCERNPEAFR